MLPWLFLIAMLIIFALAVLFVIRGILILRGKKDENKSNGILFVVNGVWAAFVAGVTISFLLFWQYL